MSAVLSPQAATQTDVGARLAFQKQLQAVTNKIHATANIDEIMLEVSADICGLFHADRPKLVQAPEAADRGAFDRRLRGARQEDGEHQGRLRRGGAARRQPQPAL